MDEESDSLRSQISLENILPYPNQAQKIKIVDEYNPEPRGSKPKATPKQYKNVMFDPLTSTRPRT